MPLIETDGTAEPAHGTGEPADGPPESTPERPDVASPTPLTSPTPPRRRRRGDDLEEALLLAAWEEFKAVGFYDLTFDAVAQRAGTSRAVLYRRWPGKIELVAAAARYAISQERGPMPEPSDSLRDDLLAWLRWANRSDVRTMIAATLHIGTYLAREGVTFGQVRQMLVPSGGRSTSTIIDQAIERGEVDPAVATPRVRSLTFDLFRHEVLLNAQPLSEEAIIEIVDEVVMPLLTRRPTGEA